MLKLIIGNKNYSSWSLRPWLLMRARRIEFEELRISLYGEGSREALRRHSPSGKVPVLEHGDLVVWDSLAICEYIAELYPGAGCWPADTAARAVARSACAEMHSGFQALRDALPMDCRRPPGRKPLDATVQADVDRICAIWRSCRERFGTGGEFLFGGFCIADAMYAPVVMRFTSYAVSLGAVERAYVSAVRQLPAMQEWMAAAAEEPEVNPRVDAAG